MITRVHSFDDRSDLASRAVPAGSRDTGGRDQGRQVPEGKPYPNRIGAGREVRDRKIDCTAVDSLATRSGTDLHRAAARVIRQLEVAPAALFRRRRRTVPQLPQICSLLLFAAGWGTPDSSARRRADTPQLRGDLSVLYRFSRIVADFHDRY